MKDILEIIREKGLLIEREIFELLNNFKNKEAAFSFLEQLERVSGQKMINRATLNKNTQYVKEFVGLLPGEDKKVVEKVFVNLGISFEIRREKEVAEAIPAEKIPEIKYLVRNANTLPDKKLEVKDFTNHFRARFHQIQKMLMSRPELQQNLTSIGRIGSSRSSLSIIGIVTEKSVTKNKNIMIKFEDLTGEIKALARFDNENRKDVFQKAEELQLDDIVGVKVSGNRDIVFIHDILYPDIFLHEKIKFEEELNVAFISDIHCGSDRHLEENFSKFVKWLNSEHEDARKIKYLFIVGDNVDGVGIFPGQENFLKLKSMQEQYFLLADYLRKVPKRITMFMCPGQHDAVRVAEPQPAISRKYAEPIYNIENLVLVTNPCYVELLEGDKKFKVLMYHGASIHTLINEIKELREMKAHSCPAKAVKHMLKRRHLAPSHGDVVYIPNAEVDPLVISEAPDVLCTGEVHRLDIERYNGILIITGSCWQGQTDFEEKIGNIPDPCKVPVLNLRTRELKIFDFSGRDGE